MTRGRNGKRAVLKDDHRDRRRRELDAMTLDSAAAVLDQRFTATGDLAARLESLAGMIRDGDGQAEGR